MKKRGFHRKNDTTDTRKDNTAITQKKIKTTDYADVMVERYRGLHGFDEKNRSR